ncbi:unnamed protein product [Schistosoma margrebowiei]|uniref:Uncharacterized protein n=1 Tax=Schistosoma margrebowiei TaxID=48269 RepID=A0A183LLV3_9TREM|nr:unnamed protein product [Schistosoma margrebowiei]
MLAHQQLKKSAWPSDKSRVAKQQDQTTFQQRH